jgi:hypothetical protein
MIDERLQHGPIIFQVYQRVDDVVPQLVAVVCRQVRQLAVLRPAPDQLVRVQLRRVAREVLRYHLGVSRQPLPHQQRLAVDPVAVPEDRPRPRQLPPQRPQEAHHLRGADVLVVGQQLEEQVRPGDTRADRNATDGRDLVAPVPALQDLRP